ncbi:dihydrofolate reductase family protein [Brachybacterium muris]|uniref:dihydrofolate reductase family protein n=1 Tax=Brachybacterium muris TaxID=219301 RepID=UPI0021A67187|nr:dihydrofolate reductase family protein [Brachybacterium muris]MCT1998358.1 dihydrofolate reductase family protein [Brachybacterium muris]
MAALVYVNNMSLDGFIEDPSGAPDFFPVDEEVFASHTELLEGASTFLYGRRLYEAMAVWETDPALAAQSELLAAFAAAWQAAQKIVCSTTLTTTPTARTRIERRFDPAAVRELKATADGPIIIGGAALAAQALEAGLVEECLLYIVPVH